MATMVAATDFALHNGLTTLEELREVLAFCHGWPGAARAARALARVDVLAESPLDSISRLTFGWLRLPAPKPQRWIYDRYGAFVGRCDFYWDEYGVAGEADGMSKLQERDDLVAEKVRQEALERLHLVIVRWNWTRLCARRACSKCGSGIRSTTGCAATRWAFPACGRLRRSDPNTSGETPGPFPASDRLAGHRPSTSGEMGAGEVLTSEIPSSA